MKHGEADNFLRLLTEVAAETAKENGSLTYDAHISISDPDNLMLVESYVDQQAVEEHRASRTTPGIQRGNSGKAGSVNQLKPF